MKNYDTNMSTFDTAVAALLNDDGWMFAYCCDQLQRSGKIGELEHAKRLQAAKIEADLMDCPF